MSWRMQGGIRPSTLVDPRPMLHSTVGPCDFNVRDTVEARDIVFLELQLLRLAYGLQVDPNGSSMPIRGGSIPQGYRMHMQPAQMTLQRGVPAVMSCS